MRFRGLRRIKVAPGLTLTVGEPQPTRRGGSIGIPHWAVFTVLLCIAAVAGVLLWEDPPAMPGAKSNATGPAPAAAPAPEAVLRGDSQPRASNLAGSARVIDGDTIELSGQRIRLWGIDAPERAQTCQGRNGDVYECGRDSAAVLRELMGGRRVECSERDRDRYGRVVAVCRTEAGEINAAIVRRGWAVDYTQYSAGRYRAEEAAAKREALGVWAGRFELPWEWRQRR